MSKIKLRKIENYEQAVEFGIVSEYKEFDVRYIGLLVDAGAKKLEISKETKECNSVLHQSLRGVCDLSFNSIILTPAINIAKDISIDKAYDYCECDGTFYCEDNGDIVCDKCGCIHEDCK